MHTENTDRARWFADEVHRHDGQLRAYLRGSYPAVRDVDDVVQESYLRMWKAKPAHPIASAKSFLFQVARNVAIDVLRRKESSATESVVDFDTLPVLEDSADIATALSRREKIDLLTEALAQLPDRTREVMFMRKFENRPQKDVAALLGVAERTVEARLAKGMKGCADYLSRRGVHGFYCDE
jgi:RNA polymerase sigma factor (sigma-70 family)